MDPARARELEEGEQQEEEEETAAIYQHGDWSVFVDDDTGNPYFFNQATNVTCWEEPEELRGHDWQRHAPKRPRLEEPEPHGHMHHHHPDGHWGHDDQHPPPHLGGPPPDLHTCPWNEVYHEGQLYYHNTVTNETSWDLPEELRVFRERQARRDQPPHHWGTLAPPPMYDRPPHYHDRYTDMFDRGGEEEEPGMRYPPPQQQQQPPPPQQAPSSPEEGEIEEGEVEEEPPQPPPQAPGHYPPPYQWTHDAPPPMEPPPPAYHTGPPPHHQPPFHDQGRPPHQEWSWGYHPPPMGAGPPPPPQQQQQPPPHQFVPQEARWIHEEEHQVPLPAAVEPPMAVGFTERRAPPSQPPQHPPSGEQKQPPPSATLGSGGTAPQPPPAAPAGSDSMSAEDAAGGPAFAPDEAEAALVAPTKKEDEAPEVELTKLQIAQQRLEAEDSILDPGIFEHVITLVKEEGARKATDQLASSYRGSANMSLLLALWLQNLSNDGTEQDLDANELVLDYVKTQIKSHFDTAKVDAVVYEQKKPRWLPAMLDSKRWRRLLIELFDEHRDSVVLGDYCMQQLSQKGHNTEIADVISVADYFSVFKGVLMELLAEVPWADHIQLWRLLSQLKRICGSTAYMHMFSQEVLRCLERDLHRDALNQPHTEGDGGDGDGEYTRAKSLIATARKYRRIREELEKAAWEEAANEADRTKIRFVHKLSAWKQVEGGRQAAGISEETSALIVSLLVNTFCDRTLSAPTIASLKQYYVPEGVFREPSRDEDGMHDSTTHWDSDGDDDDDDDGIHQIRGPLEYLRHPQLLELMVKSVFDPKRHQPTAELRGDACKLLAVASCALLDGTIDKEEANPLYHMLIKISELLLAKDEVLNWNMSTSAIPSILKGSMRYPVCAMGFIHWLRATIQDPEFHNSRQFVHVMQVFLRLIQHIIADAPLQRPAVFAALKSLITLKPSDSTTNINAMKKDALRCGAFLIAQGFVIPVIEFMDNIVKDLDQALIRHFVGLTLHVARPPYSKLFATTMTRFLREAPVGRSLKFNSMEEEHREALRNFLRDVCREGGGMIDAQNRNALKTLYAPFLGDAC